MHMNKIVVSLLCVFAACSFAQAVKKGKLVGHLEIGPLSPVERPGHKQVAPPAMYKKFTVLVTQRGPHNEKMSSHLIRVVANLKLSPKGDFSTDLDPGEYQVSVRTTERMMHVPDQRTINIAAGKTTRIELKFDTGIR